MGIIIKMNVPKTAGARNHFGICLSLKILEKSFFIFRLQQSICYCDECSDEATQRTIRHSRTFGSGIHSYWQILGLDPRATHEDDDEYSTGLRSKMDCHEVTPLAVSQYVIAMSVVTKQLREQSVILEPLARESRETVILRSEASSESKGRGDPER